jgi:choline-sulfatase
MKYCFIRLGPCLLILLAGLCWGGAEPPQTAPEQRPNILLIVVDTLRADRLGCYGSGLGATPHMDALAKEGVLFRQAYAHASWTLPSFASLLTSQTPPGHGAGGRLPRLRVLPAAVRTLAECLSDAAYATACVVNVDFLGDKFGVTQGFQKVDFEAHSNNFDMRAAGPTTDQALAWLRARPDRPFFLMVHYFDPHLLYNPPPKYRARFADPRDRVDTTWVFGTRADILAIRTGAAVPEATIRRAEKLYNGEVAYTDDQIGRLLDAIDRMGLRKNTIVVLTADHGEEFLDHGGFEHGHTLYNELVHVPLVIRYPSRLDPETRSEPVGLIDVAPTLCLLAGVPADQQFAGGSLLRPTTAAGHRPILMEGDFWGPMMRSWLEGEYKLIAGANGNELYNLRKDPGEKDNLITQEPERADRMLRDLDLACKEASSRRLPGDKGPQLSPEEVERLRSLGYIAP